MTGFEEYIRQESDRYHFICVSHRSQNNLSTNDVESIDCELKCTAYKTCPLNPDNEEL